MIKLKLLLLSFLMVIGYYSIHAQTPVVVENLIDGEAYSNVEYMTVFDNQIVFAAYDSNGTGLWKTNSAAEFADTIRVINKNPYWGNMYIGGRIANKSLPVLDNLLIFPADDNIHGNELWVSDGTYEGTKLLKDISEETSSTNSSPAQWDYMVKYNNNIYFSANSPRSESTDYDDRKLWRTDGTGLNTTNFFDINTMGNDYVRSLFAFNNGLIFSANDGTANKLWYSNGTEQGTLALSNSITNPNNFASINETVYFRAMTDGNGWELFKSKGTPESTELVKEINPGPGGGNSGYLVVLNDKIYFHGNDGIHGTELWESDGTEQGTHMVKDIWVGTESGRNINNKVFVSDSLMYFTANDNIHGKELWRSNGTSEGTYLLKDINPSGDSAPLYFAKLGDFIYFSAENQEHGRELWVTDGTTEGTKLLFDINESGSANVSNIVVLNDVLFFNATAADNVRKLYKLHPITTPLTDTVTNKANVCDIDYSRPIDSAKIISHKSVGNNAVLFNWEICQDSNCFVIEDVEYNFTEIGSNLIKLRVSCDNTGKSDSLVKRNILKPENSSSKSYLFLEVFEISESTLNVRNAQSILPDIRVFPNPTKGDFTISLEKKYNVVNIEIFNLLGQSIIDKPFYNNDKIEMELNENIGVYIVKVTSEEKVLKYFKLIIE